MKMSPDLAGISKTKVRLLGSSADTSNTLFNQQLIATTNIQSFTILLLKESKEAHDKTY